ncbi:YtxH domain-containing protein [Gemmatimonas sp.]|jgi:gas vesicle protein|uniref:YtxH domain-containing protein n=1 Tax=Gemmatimonas sp. TaxID=1962908 RepID=UPI0022C050BF|nr:YtxH domain-containing protein [Gemmatimonas sp.]MCZ8204898.1 YtxH domain-containing protein [Gemmatimonas sp.]
MARDYDDDRVVVIEKDSSNGVGLLLLGLALGAGAALLFAPASGRETRERISREARRAARRAKDVTDEFGDKLAGQVERARSGVDERLGRARHAVNSRVDAVNDAVSASRDAAREARADIERAVANSKRAYADGRRAYSERASRSGMSGEPGAMADDRAPRDGAEGHADESAHDA